MANPNLIPGFDINDVNTDAVPTSLQANGYTALQVVQSKYLNEMLKQLFAAANKNKNDGVWDWENPATSDTEYNIGSIVRYSDEIYVSLVDLNTATPIDNGSDWYKIDLGNYVKLTGDQTIEGIKSFSSFPVTPSSAPTTNYQAANKKYVDDIAGQPTISGTATFTNVDQNINMTGIGSISGLEIGDVIQVSDSISNNTEYTVEFITDSNNIVVNYEHRGQTTSKALTDETSTSGVTVKRLCKWYSAPIGLGQGWCTPPSRANNIVYTNNMNRSMAFWIRSSSNTTLIFYVDNIVYAGVGSASSSQSVVLSKNSTYEIGSNFVNWYELR